MSKEKKIVEEMREEGVTFWDFASTPPQGTTKKITGGRLKGMTDIKPMWRIKVMTDFYGPCGIGWRFEYVKKWTEHGSLDQVLALVDINLYVNDPETGKWSEPIPGHGGAKMVVKESYGLYTDDDAFKKATTDALSSAMKYLGVGADVYMGLDLESKYAESKARKAYMTKAQSDKFIKFCKEENLEPTEVAKQYGITKKVTVDSFENIFAQVKAHVESGELGYRHVIEDGEEEPL